VQEKITDGFENALNYSHDDFHEDRHATTILLLSRRVAAWNAVRKSILRWRE
jgi:hypothetical protein